MPDALMEHPPSADLTDEQIEAILAHRRALSITTPATLEEAAHHARELVNVVDADVDDIAPALARRLAEGLEELSGGV